MQSGRSVYLNIKVKPPNSPERAKNAEFADSLRRECTGSNETAIESIPREILEDSNIYMCCRVFGIEEIGTGKIF